MRVREGRVWLMATKLGFFKAGINWFSTTQERQHYSSPGDSHHPLIWPETLNRSRQSNPHFAYSKLTLTLIDLGYTYKKIGDNRRVLYDQVSIINDRCNYLR
jgi:hypothetical protein